jgi:multisubunit Na+/H+ antiporter MnhC subunit
VGVAVIGVALSLIVTIKHAYGTLDDSELSERDGAPDTGGDRAAR